MTSSGFLSVILSSNSWCSSSGSCVAGVCGSRRMISTRTSEISSTRILSVSVGRACISAWSSWCERSAVSGCSSKPKNEGSASNDNFSGSSSSPATTGCSSSGASRSSIALVSSVVSMRVSVSTSLTSAGSSSISSFSGCLSSSCMDITAVSMTSTGSDSS